MSQNGTPKKQAAFLAAYVETGSISHAARAAETSRTSHYRWMEEDEEYPEIFEAARDEALEILEHEARFRAVEGLRQYKFDRDGNALKHPITGEPYYENKKSDVLLIFLLKAADPEKYRERTETQLRGEVNLGKGVRILEDDDWYGNRERLNALAAPRAQQKPDEIV
jgi:hypothetical protein